MYEYEIRVRIGQGGFTDIKIRANDARAAQQLIEGSYGQNSYMGLISEKYVGN